MKNKKLTASLLVVLICITLSGCGSQTSDEAPQVEANVDVKITHPRSSTDSLFIEGQGRVNSNSTYAIPALSEGKLVRTYVKEGEPVKSGQTIAQLANIESNSELAIQQAKLNVNQNAINNLENRLRTAREMVNLGIIAQNDVANIQNDLNTRKAERQDILSPIRKLQIRNANNIVASVYSGYVVSVLPAGSFVTYGQTVANIVSLADLYVETFVPVDQMNIIKSGQEAIITANGISVYGRILNVYPNASSNLIRVIVRPYKPLPVNLDVKVKLKRTGINGLVIPKTAVILNNNIPTIFIVKGNKAYQKSITIQKDYVDKVIVSQGLSAFDNVVTENAYLLSDGTKVTVK